MKNKEENKGNICCKGCYKLGIQEGKAIAEKDKLKNEVIIAKFNFEQGYATARLEFEKKIDDAGLQDVIDFIDNLKNLRIDEQSKLNYEDGELPFGTCDYMAIDDMIVKLQSLNKKRR